MPLPFQYARGSRRVHTRRYVDTDITLSAEDRKIGGLGIFMVKKSMDDIVYEYNDGKNILKVKKNF